MAKKKEFRFPKWLTNTLKMTIMITALMAAYNYFGPLIYKNGTYFPWYTFPYSIVSALFLIGGWNFLSHRANIIHNQMVADDKAKEEREKREQRIRETSAAKEKAEAEKRRQRNAGRNRNKQQSR